MEKKVKTKVLGTYAGHSVKINKTIDVTFKCTYDQIVEYITIIQFLNADVMIKVKVPTEDAILSLGTFRVKGVSIDHDGEGKIQFTSTSDFVELDNIDHLIGTEVIKLMFSATVEVEEEDNEE